MIIEYGQGGYAAWKTPNRLAHQTILRKINMIDLYLSLNQQNREQQDLSAMNELADRNTELESCGNWDGRLNEPAQEKHWGELAYRKGYVTGITQYYDQKYHISIEEF